MPTQSIPAHRSSWQKAFVGFATEFGPTALPLLSGALPEGLQGTLYRNGPARFERGGQRIGHWFDGDGAVLAVEFTPTAATGVYRYVQTSGYRAEAQAGRFLLSGYGMQPPGPIWQRFQRGLKNAANTSVLALPDKLLALWEGGRPYALHSQTLETWGEDDLGELTSQTPYSAHPKRDPQTDAIYNFGVSYGKQAVLHLYRSDRTGQIRQQAAIPLDTAPLLHDFVLAGAYLVFMISPLQLNALPLLLRLQSYSDALQWQPQRGTQILVIDRDRLTVVSRNETEPWFQWHFGNGFVDDEGRIGLNLVRYPDFRTNEYLREVPTGAPQTIAPGTLWQLCLDPQTGKVLSAEEGVAQSCEFPMVSPLEVGQASRFTYCSIRTSRVAPTDLFDAIARFDAHTGALTVADLGSDRYPTEPIYAPDAHNPERGWILTVVFDASQNQSEVWIFAADHLEDGPVCCLALPSPIPPGFHGTWQPGHPNQSPGR